MPIIPKIQFLFFALIISLVRIEAQPDYTFTGKLIIDHENFTVDPLGNIYFINHQNIRKYNNYLQKTADYSNVFLGNISFADVSDPLRILLYYNEMNQAVWLDKWLQELRSPVRLDDLGIDQAVLICASNLGGLWIYDQLNNQLQYFDNNLKKIHESISLTPLVGDTKPVSMTEKNRMVYLYFPGEGILTFDQFGTYSRTLPLFPDHHFQVTDENIYYFKDLSIMKYNLITYKEEKILLPDTIDVKSVLILSENLYIRKKEGVYIYKSSSGF